MERSTIKLEVSLINKIKEIQALNGYKSVNETVKHMYVCFKKMQLNFDLMD